MNPNIRSSGLLLPIFSLPSRFGIGDMGPSAYKFADLLNQTGQQIWQILPLNPTSSSHGHSPYYCPSAFALNPLLISPELMARDGWISKHDIQNVPAFRSDRVVYHQVLRYKNHLFASAYKSFQKSKNHREYDQFNTINASWLEDYALFSALKTRHKKSTWNDWPPNIRLRRKKAIASCFKDLFNEINRIKFLQFLAHNQWQRLKSYCNDRCIHIFGDMPIYIPYDSADVWSHPRLFKLDTQNCPSVVSGVPPDYFSKTGQRWGHPVYEWKYHQKTGFDWWLDRIARNLSLFDMVRIDHFRGLVAYWEIPAKDKTAVNGKWVPAPVNHFFDAVMRRFINPPIIAEDLGLITPDVREVINKYDFSGMRVLVFGFSGNLSENPNAFHHISPNTFAYTGTHDTNTVKGWFETEASEKDKSQVFSYLGRKVTSKEISWELIRLAMMSKAKMVVIPLQDILGLDSKARMNRPARSRGNWQWRVSKAQLASFPRKQLLEATRIYGRM